MSRTVILGAGVSGHTAALHLRRLLPRGHEVVVVTPNSHWNWIPSNIWVGVGDMGVADVEFPLAPVYRRQGIRYVQAKAVAIHPEGVEGYGDRAAVDIVHTSPEREGEHELVHYDYLVNATGPRLRFEATPGLGPQEGHTVSVCTADHATHASAELAKAIDRLRAGEQLTLVVGTGHGTCTCEGAAFEYAFNVDHTLREAGVRHRAEVVYLTNEYELGDFGVDGATFDERGYQTSSRLWTESLFREREVRAITGAAVRRVDEHKITYELLDGSVHFLEYDFAMLLPPFGGVPLRAVDRAGQDITAQLFAPSGFMYVDAAYGAKEYEQWSPQDWPSTYQCPAYDNIWAVGIAFAPPHAISRPRHSPNGTVIAPAPPRTGMPSGMMGKAVAMTIADRVRRGRAAHPHTASMAHMGAACVASAGTGLRRGSAAAITMLPVVPDYQRYPTGRDLAETKGEIGLAGHWLKLSLHHLFLYKNKARPGWFLIPE